MKISAFHFFLFISLAGLSSLNAASTSQKSHQPKQGTKITWKSQNNTLPPESGPGIVICEPVTAPATSSFGTGCALWLQVVVGGQPQFGKTPLWNSLDRARTEMKRPDLQLSRASAVQLAPILGVTDAAVGTLRGKEPHLILTYRLLQVPSGAAAGPAITLTGTQAQIADGLPQMARTFIKELGGAATPSLPASTGLTSRDLQMLGEVRWRKDPYTDVQRLAVEAMAVHSPVAGMMSLLRRRGGHTQHFHFAVETLLAQAGDNTFVWSVITKRTNLSLLQHDAQLSALVARYPHNSSLALIKALRDRLTQDRKPEIQAVEQAIKDAPHSPDVWHAYSEAVSGAASDIRKGRYYGALSSSEADDLGHLYAASEAAAHQAVRLDPGDAESWKSLAEEATFNSDAALADHALQMALALSEDKKAVYYWALQMYQPKWDDDPAKLGKFARMAAADTTLNVDDVITLAPELKSCGYPDLKAKMLSSFIARQQAAIALHPDDGQAHFELAIVQKFLDLGKEALTEYKMAAALLPDDATLHESYGTELYTSGDYAQAEVQIQEALKIDPDFPEAHYTLSEVLQAQNNLVDARRELKAVLALDPAYADAYSNLAMISQDQNNYGAAIPDYQSAIRFGDTSRTTYANFIDLASSIGHDEQVTTTGEAALNLWGDAMLKMYKTGSMNLYDIMANAYLHQKKWGEAVAICQSAIEYDANDAAAQERQAEAYLGEGKITDAQDGWKKVLALNDDQQKSLAQDFLKKYP